MLTINDAESLDDFTDTVVAKIKANFVCIPRTSLPKLPEGWSGPFRAEPHSEYSSVYCLCDATLDRSLAVYLSKGEATFLAALLNACYSANQ